ncbi:G5 and 3D domain-containing protein [uncultured Oscillibacter sp.]|uniref:G5 and 3D domain-containing protein n=1 Tax=uncultured Oscillibacter sp. TaxID=876091 RepID=UPI0025ECE765|nr:G5 domain-containing protein [uncultured Oscillibacter sp.]
MNTDQRQQLLYTLCRRGSMLLFCLLVAAVTGLSATGWADSLFLITGTDDGAILLDPAQKTPPDLSSQMLYVSSGGRGYDLTLREDTTVTVRHEGTAVTVQSRKESVSTLLSRLHVYPSPLEMIGVTVSDSGVDLNIASDLTYYDYVTENVSFTTQRVANPEMEVGQEKVVQEGADGVRSSVYEVVWSNGTELSRQFVEELSTTAVERIVEYGTKTKAKPASPDKADPDSILTEHGETGGGIASVSENADGSGTLTLKDGTVLNYSGVRTMTATAYTTGHDGVGTRTASGTAVHVGTVAVDKSVLPLGTRMYIVAGGSVVYGLAVAEDTGVKGNKIDLFYDTYDECIQFGRRTCTVYILQ